MTGFLDEDDLANNAQLDTVTCADLNDSFHGYFITGRDAEKFLSRSVIFLGELYFGSFVPPDPSTADPCESTGESFLYNFDLDCAVGQYPSNPGSGNEDRRIMIGKGLPTRPRVSVGGLIIDKDVVGRTITMEGGEILHVSAETRLLNSEGAAISLSQVQVAPGGNGLFARVPVASARYEASRRGNRLVLRKLEVGGGFPD